MTLYHPIGCRLCRQRKVRCDRILPSCTSCVTRGRDCVYDARKERARKSLRPNTEPTTSIAGHDATSGTSPISFPSIAESSPVADESGLLGDEPIPQQDLATKNVDYARLSEYPLRIAKSVLDISRHFLNISGHSQATVQDVCDTLNAMENTICGTLELPELPQHSGDAEPFNILSIPREKQKKWVDDFLSKFDIYVREVSKEKDLMKTVPDLIGHPHINFSTALTIVYYAIMYYGSSADPDLPLESQPAEKIYRELLELAGRWKVNIATSAMDFLACYILCDITSVFMDLESSWFYYCECCRLAKALGFFDIDADTSPPDSIISSDVDPHAEDKRYFFWDLMQIDCMFRLLTDKPSIMPLSHISVKFPALPSDAMNQNTRQLHFIVTMRVIFSTLQIWGTIPPSPLNDQQIASDDRFENAQNEIESIIDGWDVISRFENCQTGKDKCFFADTLFSCYMMISFLELQRQAEQPRPLSTTSKRAARAYFELVRGVVVEGHGPYAWGTRYIGIYAFAPVQILYQNILETTDAMEASACLAILEWLLAVLKRWLHYQRAMWNIYYLVSTILEFCRKLVPLKRKGRPFQGGQDR